MRHQWRDGKYNLLPMHPGVLSTVGQSNSLISSSPPYPHPSGFFYHWNKIQSSYWAHSAFAYVVPTSWMVPPPNVHAPCLLLLLLQPFPLSPSLLHPSSLVLMTQRNEGRVAHHTVVCDPCSPGASYFILSFCGVFCMLFILGSLGRKGLHRRRC